MNVIIFVNMYFYIFYLEMRTDNEERTWENI